jgi:hypothetical protein
MPAYAGDNNVQLAAEREVKLVSVAGYLPEDDERLSIDNFNVDGAKA